MINVTFAPLLESLERGGSVSGRPLDGEFASYAAADIEAVAGADATRALRLQGAATLALLDPLCDDDVRMVSYAPGKWTVKEVIGHLCDDERIFVYRAMCIARGDSRPLPGFDERLYVEHASFESVPLADLVAHLAAVRLGTIAFLRGLPADAWLRRGLVNGYSATVRGLAFHIAGHELRHVRALREKYGVARPRG